jgi:hypothetical protein
MIPQRVARMNSAGRSVSRHIAQASSKLRSAALQIRNNREHLGDTTRGLSLPDPDQPTPQPSPAHPSCSECGAILLEVGDALICSNSSCGLVF